MPQRVYVNPRCLEMVNRRLLAHEIGHLFGLFHEHNRPDRDDYIHIVWKNVQKGKENQFEIKYKNQSVSFNSPYDFGSLMQYPLDHHSKQAGVPTMVPKIKYDGPIGVNIEPSQMDIQQLNYLYGCVPCKSTVCLCVFVLIHYFAWTLIFETLHF